MEKSDIIEINKEGTLYPWHYTLRHRYKGWDRNGWNGYWLHYLYLFFPNFFAITFTYHDWQTQKLTFLTMRARKSTLQRFYMPGCASISGYLHMTTQTTVLIKTLKALISDLRWLSCNIFSAQDHTVAVIAHDESAAMFPGRLVVSRITGTASWMPWYILMMVARFTELTWLLMMGVAWLF